MTWNELTEIVRANESCDYVRKPNVTHEQLLQDLQLLSAKMGDWVFDRSYDHIIGHTYQLLMAHKGNGNTVAVSHFHAIACAIKSIPDSTPGAARLYKSLKNTKNNGPYIQLMISYYVQKLIGLSAVEYIYDKSNRIDADIVVSSPVGKIYLHVKDTNQEPKDDDEYRAESTVREVLRSRKILNKECRELVIKDWDGYVPSGVFADTWVVLALQIKPKPGRNLLEFEHNGQLHKVKITTGWSLEDGSHTSTFRGRDKSREVERKSEWQEEKLKTATEEEKAHHVLVAVNDEAIWYPRRPRYHEELKINVLVIDFWLQDGATFERSAVYGPRNQRKVARYLESQLPYSVSVKE